MRIAVVGLWVAVFIAGYQGKVPETQPKNIQNARQNSPAKAVTPISNFAPAERKQSAYQKTYDYMKLAFGPETIASWALVLAAGIGLFATFRTLRILRTQTEAIVRDADATKEAATATQKSVELQKAAMRQWVNTDNWEADRIFIQPAATEADLPINFRIVNPTKFQLTLRSELWVNRRKNRLVVFRKLVVPPDDGTRVELSYKLKGPNIASYPTNSLQLEIGGLIKFEDMFEKDQEQLFGITCTCGASTSGEFDSTAFTPPRENEENM